MKSSQPPFFRRRLNSFGYALKGIKAAFRTEFNLRWHCLSTVLVIATGFFLQITRVDWIFVFVAVGLVWMAELFNTAIEVVVNLVSPEPHPLAGKAKDIAAGAVLIISMCAVLIGALVFMPYLELLVQKLG
ncbi:diacylglycerol kinase family protein [Rufibacter roseus]|uniref:Diacylglycerol kinase family protein n=1 Tax=Rufibacter roseus TaxID=1567108 RepID=A0ABW2DIG7_9BACT|nr:diacylglycerol kinase family protein [Rufibacter roseus]